MSSINNIICMCFCVSLVRNDCGCRSVVTVVSAGMVKCYGLEEHLLCVEWDMKP